MFYFIFHFFTAIVIADILLIIFRRRMSKTTFVAGLALIPFVTFVAFYDDRMIAFNSWSIYLVGYCGSLWTLFTFLNFCTLQSNIFRHKKNFALPKCILLTLIQYPLLCLMMVAPWALDTFPLTNGEAVIFTLFVSPNDGAYDFVIDTLKNNVIIKGLIVWVILFFLQLTFCVISSKKSSSAQIASLLVQTEKKTVLFILGVSIISLFVIPSIFKTNAFKAYFEEPIDSLFYKECYISPDSIFTPKQISPKNLIVIFLESMANNFEKYTPELNLWKSKGVNFVPGAQSVSGTSWTIAGITAALCGLPINMPFSDSEYHGSLPTYLPKATCLMDLLKQNEYNQIFVQGSNGDFTQKRSFWATHGNVKMYDDSAIKQSQNLPKDYHVFWGVEDKKTLSFAKKMIDSLSSLQNPFAAYLLTVDTHQPNGYIDSSCHYDENSDYKKALRCSSAMVGDFLDWTKTQSWYENTIIVLVGDHTLPLLATKVNLPPDETMYTTAFFLNAPKDGINTTRKFSNLDYAPSILEALGWILPKHAFGLGRSLFSKEQTLLEIYNRDKLDEYLRQRTLQYDYFLYGKD